MYTVLFNFQMMRLPNDNLSQFSKQRSLKIQISLKFGKTNCAKGSDLLGTLLFYLFLYRCIQCIFIK